MTMFKELKKRAVRNMVWVVMICLVAGAICIAADYKNALIVIKGAKDITNASVKTIRDAEYAEIKLDKNNVYGCFSELYSGDSKSKAEAYYYLVLVGDENDSRLMAVKLKAKNYNKMQKIEEEYTAMDNGEDLGRTTTVVIKGKLTAMESEPYSHFKDTIIDTYDYDYSDIPMITLNLMVDEGNPSFFDVVLFYIGVIMIAGSVVALILTATGVTLTKVKKQLETKGPGYIDYVEKDFMGAVNYGKFRVGKEFTFFIKGMSCVIIPNSEIVWAYPVKTTHKTNGIKTGTTYNVKVFTINKKSYMLPTDGETKANEVIDVYCGLTDTIVLGYDPELMRMYSKRFDEFLNITYKNHTYGIKENQSDMNYDNENYGNNNYDNDYNNTDYSDNNVQ